MAYRILRDPLANLHGCGSDHGIEVGIVIRLPAKDFDTERSFFQRFRMTMKRAFHHKTQQIREAPALLEEWTGEDPLQLFANRVALSFGFRSPRRGGMSMRIDRRPSLRTTTPGTEL